MKDTHIQTVTGALDGFRVETPSWGYADTGTRFGKFTQDAAAIDLRDKLADAGEVHKQTACCPTVAVHVLWDFQPGQDPKKIAALAEKHGVKIGAVNPNVFQDQCYKFGSFGNNNPKVRKAALDHVLDSVKLGKALKSKYLSLWFADGTNYPGQDNVRQRKRYFEQCLAKTHKALGKNQIMLVEYKPFEPAFYFTDIADWGMAYIFAKKAGPQAKVLVDTGHHYQGQNVEQIVAFLLDEQMLGGFHFNDRRYADDDLTMASIDPYQIFRIFNEIHGYAHDAGGYPEIAYMVDQSHNLKPKIEAMIQTVMMAQELYAKAALVDQAKLKHYQKKQKIVEAEEQLQQAFRTDVTPALEQWRGQNGAPANPLQAHRDSGYAEKAAAGRKKRRAKLGLSQSSSYA